MSLYLRFTTLGLFLLAILVSVTGCQTQSSPDPKEGSSTTTKQVTVEVTGMSCGVACPPRVREALTSLSWAKNVQVSYERKQATFTVAANQYDEAAIVRVLEAEGFGGKVTHK